MALTSLDNPALSKTTTSEDLPRRQLRQILELYGRSLCDEPQRCEALLRDLCPGHRREIFLLVSALRERVVPEILASLGVLPEEVIVSKLTRKLCDNLGLTEQSSRWAAESWVQVIRDAPVRGKLKPPALRASEVSAAALEGPSKSSSASLDWVWLGLCFLSIVSCVLALTVVARVIWDPGWVSILDWVKQTGLLAGGLTLAWGGDWIAARQLARCGPPRLSALDPRKTPAALLVEVLVLLTQPIAPVGTLALWILGWSASLHYIGPSHATAFTLGRVIQSAVILGFVIKWTGLMTMIQGRIASSMVRMR